MPWADTNLDYFASSASALTWFTLFGLFTSVCLMLQPPQREQLNRIGVWLSASVWLSAALLMLWSILFPLAPTSLITALTVSLLSSFVTLSLVTVLRLKLSQIKLLSGWLGIQLALLAPLLFAPTWTWHATLVAGVALGIWTILFEHLRIFLKHTTTPKWFAGVPLELTTLGFIVLALVGFGARL